MSAVVPGGILAGAALVLAQSQNPPQYTPQMPGQLQLPPVPTVAPSAPKMTPKMRKAFLEGQQKEIKSNVEKLFSLAQDLKTQADKMDSTQVLSVAFLQKTEEIEKLAKKINGLARD